MAAPPRCERIDGDGFAVEPSTPWLAARIERAAAAFAAALESGGLAGLRLERGHVVHLAGPGLELWPDLAIVSEATPDAPPALVVELRRDSTDRFALGIKRLAYAAAGIPRYFFIEPKERTLRALALVAGTTRYEWPGLLLGPTDSLELPGGGRLALDEVL